jgi:pimeloyl-ACP methyl ester carboxylesterase
MQEQFLQVKGLEICLCEWGDSVDPTVLILHGWLDQAVSWAEVAEGLVAQGYHVLALDHRGHGRSGHLVNYCEYHFPDYIADLQEVILQLQLEDFILIGHSMGGTIASIYSALCPKKPRHLILVDGVGTRHEEESKATLRYERHLRQRREESVHRVMASKENAVLKLQANHPYLSTEKAKILVNRTTKKQDGGWVWSWDSRHRNRSAIGFHLPRFLSLLGQISIPVTLVFGGESWYVQLPDLPERIKAFPNTPKQVILPTGHSPHLEAPELLVEALRSSLEEM